MIQIARIVTRACPDGQIIVQQPPGGLSCSTLPHITLTDPTKVGKCGYWCSGKQVEDPCPILELRYAK